MYVALVTRLDSLMIQKRVDFIRRKNKGHKFSYRQKRITILLLKMQSIGIFLDAISL